MRDPAYADARRDDYLRKRYGITLSTFSTLLEEQGGVCAICEAPEPDEDLTSFAVDHDHKCCPGTRSCGACVRGILCSACNRGLGLFRDDAESLKKAASYLSSRTPPGPFL